MAPSRTAWHPLFAALVKERAPPGVQVTPEYQLTIEPQRADLLVIRCRDLPREDERAGVMRALWPRLSADTLVEFKSTARPARFGDFGRLLGYGGQYWAAHTKRLKTAADLTLAMAVASVTPTLLDEAAALGWTISDLGGGYRSVKGNVYPTFIAVIDEIAEAEPDDLLGGFGHGTLKNKESLRWWWEHAIGSTEDQEMIQNLEGYEEVVQKMLQSLPAEQRLAGLKAEERLAGLEPEERLAGLSTAEKILALPDDVLRGLSADFIATLHEDVQAAIRERLRH